jgi:periplasmic protein CpxP/Spy
MTIASSAKARSALVSSIVACMLATASPVFAADQVRPPKAVGLHIKHLHDQLKITPDEEQQWSGVAQVMLDNASSMDDAMKERARKAGTMSAVDDLNSYQAIVAAHADGLKKLETAFAPLYAAMPQAQQHTADAVFGHRTASRLRAHG